ncbi:MAG TPA: CDP-alcohol phosphatidyltransferase family protein [Acidobacteriaceae bacterium]|nr:CDP-alcohol phosphatidyltransferase family protein [Acidobacteriaceae bacterium]
MHFSIRRQQIPWALAGVRAALGLILIAGAQCNWSGVALAAMVLGAAVSDIYDGVLARRWKCDTAGVRLFDTVADTIFYFCAGMGLWLARPEIFRKNAALLLVVLAMEAFHFGFDYSKFGKPASYHSWLAKSWGMVLATSLVVALATPFGSGMITLSLIVGIACKAEGLAMSFLLKEWERDVRTLAAAWALR